ncbi:hypothetical protein EDB82DRAFT_490361 [Fusarium venenatum]|uniref:uncharacterized protein n=1 Tax=Fusarium venenatum TaxID=56646 RepID=UPI001DE508B2|nr:hypothetical protein EDB82DRAFT_490361 [Fusarium venenatum]
MAAEALFCFSWDCLLLSQSWAQLLTPRLPTCSRDRLTAFSAAAMHWCTWLDLDNLYWVVLGRISEALDTLFSY